MKNIVILISLLSILTCYAQENIVAIEQKSEHDPFERPKIYYKDINGVMDKFIGTWKSIDIGSNKTFIITFSKNEKVDRGGSSLTDELVSKFKYTVDGVTVFDLYNDGYSSISGAWIVPNSSFINQAGLIVSNNKMKLFYCEPAQERRFTERPTGNLLIEYRIVENRQILEWNVSYYSTMEAEIPFKIPITMTLVKQ